MECPIRKTARVLLLNQYNEILLMCIEGFDISSAEGVLHPRFWCTIGGGLEEGESIQQAVIREIYEETGIVREDIIIGPVVWCNEIELIFKGTLTRFKETYTVVKTAQQPVMLHAGTEDEKRVVKGLQWWSYDNLQKTDEMIFPVLLKKYLSDIIKGRYPEQPIDIS